MRLFYFYDTMNRGPSEFLDDCGKQQISQVNKIALESVAHLIEVEGNANIVLGGAAAEQLKMFGGEPNQIVSMVRPSQS